MKKILTFILLLIITFSLKAQTRKEQVWEIIRKNDYILAAGVGDKPSYFPNGFEDYPNAGLKTLFNWSTGDNLLNQASQADMQWIGRARDLQNLRRQYDNYSGGVAANYVDEPSYKSFEQHGIFYAKARTVVPEVIYFSTLLPSYAQGSGLGKIEGTWTDHIDDYITKTNPDALIWNFYPYGSGACILGGFAFQPRFNDNFYSDMEYIKNKGIENNIPYGGWLSAFGSTCPGATGREGFGFRYPSESDFRYHAFAQLAYGSHIMMYFNYATASSAEGVPVNGFITQTGGKLPIYNWSKTLSPMIRNIGNETNLMVNIGVRWLEGKTGNPSAVLDWRADDLNKDVEYMWLSEPREDENGLIGFFKGLNNNPGKGFVVVNTNQAGNRNSQGQRKATLNIRMKLGKKLWKMNTSTGEVEECILSSSRTYKIFLERGTGELFYTEVADYDNDGIPNWYERKHQLDLLKADATTDNDGDCFSNLEEYQNNTNPNTINLGKCISCDTPGAIRYNKATGKLQGCNNRGWVDFH